MQDYYEILKLTTTIYRSKIEKEIESGLTKKNILL